MAEDTIQPGYLISFNKQTSQLGEVVQISTNLPVGSTKEQISDEITKIAWALDYRLESKNSEVTKKTGKSLKEMGVNIPGFNDQED